VNFLLSNVVQLKTVALLGGQRQWTINCDNELSQLLALFRSGGVVFDPVTSPSFLALRNALTQSADRLLTLLQFAEEDASFDPELEQELARFELRVFLSRADDLSDVHLTIRPREGNDDAYEWIRMLVHLYTRWAEREGYQAATVAGRVRENGGLEFATLEIKGEFAFGLLSGEIGVHSLIRLSDSARRPNSISALVDVLPFLGDDLGPPLQPAELQRDTFRTGGPGGQHL
jgi:peptide chain release factor 2